MRPQGRWSAGTAVGMVAVFVMMTVDVSAVQAQAAHVRWDIISLNSAVTPATVSAGGMASAEANDGSKITLTGTGIFVAPAGGSGASSAVTGGGTWETFAPGGASTASGTYSVTGLVRWEVAPFTSAGPTTDLIGNPAERSAGLVVLRVAYSDGSRGILVVSCHLVGSPDSIFEGVNASKDFAHYFNPMAPVAGVDANRTLFHVAQ